VRDYFFFNRPSVVWHCLCLPRGATQLNAVSAAHCVSHPKVCPSIP